MNLRSDWRPIIFWLTRFFPIAMDEVYTVLYIQFFWKYIQSDLKTFQAGVLDMKKRIMLYLIVLNSVCLEIQFFRMKLHDIFIKYSHESAWHDFKTKFSLLNQWTYFLAYRATLGALYGVYSINF